MALRTLSWGDRGSLGPPGPCVNTERLEDLPVDLTLNYSTTSHGTANFTAKGTAGEHMPKHTSSDLHQRASQASYRTTPRGQT